MKSYIYIFLISMVPLIELRGAVPVAVAMGLPVIPSYIIAIIGNLVPIPFIYYFAQRVLIWGSKKSIFRRPFTWLLNRGTKAGEKLQKKGSSTAAIFFTLMLFVGIPLPGTGAWTGCLGASILHLKPWVAFLAITLGVVIAGIIMLIASFGVVGIVSR